MALLINRYKPAGEGVGLMTYDDKGEYVKHQDHEVLMSAKDHMIGILRSELTNMRHEARHRGWRARDDGSED